MRHEGKGLVCKAIEGYEMGTHGYDWELAREGLHMRDAAGSLWPGEDLWMIMAKERACSRGI